MVEAIQNVLSQDENVRYALLFGSAARGALRRDSDVDIAMCFSRRPSNAELGELVADLELAAGRPVDLVDLERAGTLLAWKVFKEGQPLLIRDRQAYVERKVRAILDWLGWKPHEERLVAGCCGRRPMVDRSILARKLVALRDALARSQDEADFALAASFLPSELGSGATGGVRGGLASSSARAVLG